MDQLIIILWLLMMVAISELELRSMPDQWRLNLANNLRSHLGVVVILKGRIDY